MSNNSSCQFKSEADVTKNRPFKSQEAFLDAVCEAACFWQQRFLLAAWFIRVAPKPYPDKDGERRFTTDLSHARHGYLTADLYAPLAKYPQHVSDRDLVRQVAHEMAHVLVNYFLRPLRECLDGRWWDEVSRNEETLCDHIAHAALSMISAEERANLEQLFEDARESAILPTKESD